MSYLILTLSSPIFRRLLSHAPEELQREAKEEAKRVIPAFWFTEEDIRRKLAQEKLWNEFSEDDRQEAIRWLMDADEYDSASIAADQSISEAVRRLLHEVSLEMEELQRSNELAC